MRSPIGRERRVLPGRSEILERPPEPLLLQGKPGHTDICSAASEPRANRAGRNWQEWEFMRRE